MSRSTLEITGLPNGLPLLNMAAELELGNPQKTIVSRYHVKNYGTTTVLRLMAKYRNLAYMRQLQAFRYFSIKDEKVKGRIYVIGECFYQFYPWIVLRKMSPLTVSLNKIIFELNASGILHQWKELLLPAEKKLQERKEKKLTLNDVTGVFGLLLLGLALSSGVFAGELIWTSAKRRSKTVRLVKNRISLRTFQKLPM